MKEKKKNMLMTPNIGKEHYSITGNIGKGNMIMTPNIEKTGEGWIGKEKKTLNIEEGKMN